MRPAEAADPSYRDDPHAAALFAYYRELGFLIASEPSEHWLKAGAFDVHVDIWEPDETRAVCVLLHGGGGNGRLLGGFAALLAGRGIRVLCPDLPGFGLTKVPDKNAIRYDDWRSVAAAVLKTTADETGGSVPVIASGMSMGGLLAYDACVKTRAADGLVVTNLLDPTRLSVRKCLTMIPLVEYLPWSLGRFTPGFLARRLIPMRFIAPMGKITNDQRFAELILADPTAAGNSMPLGFLLSFGRSVPLMAPGAFDLCPVVLAHPGQDHWTPTEVSTPFLDEIKGETELVMLENAGHAPIEQPGRDQFVEAVAGLAQKVGKENVPA